MQEHKLGEVGNETTSSSRYISGIFLSKIIKIGQCLTKLQLMKDGDVFETRRTYIFIARQHTAADARY